MANKNWARWIHSSIALYLHEVAEDVGLPVLIEGIDERDDTFMEATDRVEVRVNGPYTNNVSKGLYKTQVFVNCLFFSRMESTKNVWELNDFLGVFHEAMDTLIPVFKYGTGPDDNELESIGCLSPADGKNDSIKVIHFGQINASTREREGMVDAKYLIDLTD